MRTNYSKQQDFPSFSKLIVLIALISSIATFKSINAQSNITTHSRTVHHPICILKIDPNATPARVPARSDIRVKIANRDTPCANFDVTYVGFEGNQAAQDAFQYAVDIWAHSIESPVQITMTANFTDLGDTGALGSAGPETVNQSDGAGFNPNFWYARALYEAIQGFDDSITGDSNDITANFNSNPAVNWYFGTDANPPSNQIDFVSVVLHEIGHGLGFLGGASVDLNAGTGSVNLGPRPVIYTNFIDFGDGSPILDVEDDTADMLAALRSNDLYCDSPTTNEQNGGTPARIFAPEDWDQGSSYSHWNEATYLPGDINSLMTPFIGNGQANHYPGDITLGFFQDMGWILCQSLSANDFVAEDISISPVPFESRLEINLPSSLSFEQIEIVLHDITGKVVLERTEAPFDGKIELENLDQIESNLYFVSITSPSTNQTITKKIIKN